MTAVPSKKYHYNSIKSKMSNILRIVPESQNLANWASIEGKTISTEKSQYSRKTSIDPTHTVSQGLNEKKTGFFKKNNINVSKSLTAFKIIATVIKI